MTTAVPSTAVGNRKVFDLASGNRPALATKLTLLTEKRGQQGWKGVDDVYHRWLLPPY